MVLIIYSLSCVPENHAVMATEIFSVMNVTRNSLATYIITQKIKNMQLEYLGFEQRGWELNLLPWCLHVLYFLS